MAQQVAQQQAQQEVAAVRGSVVELLRTVRRSKARMAAAASTDVESATQLLLHTVAAEGPLRTSALAASVHADLSTVSRQVASLVGQGLLERQADQLDGRASLLVVTDAGQAVIATWAQARDAFFNQILTGWTDAELRQFAVLLDRFTAAYDQTHNHWMIRTAEHAGHTEAAEAAGHTEAAEHAGHTEPREEGRTA